jgi:flagellar biosynthesis chaperone FliJ
LDLKSKQEEILRAELVSVTEQVVAVRGQILMERSLLRQRLSEAEQAPPKERPARQAFILQFSQVTEDKIRRLHQKLQELETARRNKIQEILKVRTYRKGLERLRARAEEDYQLEQQRQEQKQSDDQTTVGYARRLMRPV